MRLITNSSARAAEHAIDEIADGVARGSGFGHGGAVDVGAAVELAAQLALAVEDVEHGLDGGVGEVLGEGLLDGGDGARAVAPDDLHDL